LKQNFDYFRFIEKGEISYHFFQINSAIMMQFFYKKYESNESFDIIKLIKIDKSIKINE
jgi:hypothetical protein